MFAYSIENPRFYKDESSGMVSCTFFVKNREYWLPPDDYFKPTFLLNGCVPLDTEGEIDPVLLAKIEDLKPNFKSLGYLSTDPRLVRLGFIHFLENYHNRSKEGSVPDNLDIKELAEFWVLNKNDELSYRDWVKVVKAVLEVKISD
jgi:hypothetical protein